MSKVEWRRAPSPYGNYEVSSDGRVRRNGKELSQGKDFGGYPSVGLSYAGISKKKAVHRLVCEVFNGPPPFPKAQAAHEDGVRTNNASSNLSWKTPKENCADMARHGTRRVGEGHWSAKLTREDAAAIKSRRANGESLRKLGAAFGVSGVHVLRITRGDYW